MGVSCSSTRPVTVTPAKEQIRYVPRTGCFTFGRRIVCHPGLLLPAVHESFYRRDRCIHAPFGRRWGPQAAQEWRRSDADFSPLRGRLQREILDLPVSRADLYLAVSSVPAAGVKTVFWYATAKKEI